MTRVVAVIPALDEAATIAEVVRGARDVAQLVIVVDDGSRDETAMRAGAAGATVVSRAANGGKGAALRDGFRTALAEGATVVVTLDADGQHDPSEMKRLVEPVLAGRADLVVGSRRLGDRAGIPRHRRAGQAVFTRAASATTKLSLTDSESGYRAYDAHLLRRLRLHEDGYGTEWEALVRAADLGARIVEVPIRTIYGVASPSKIGSVRHGAQLGHALLRFARFDRPLAFFGMPGLILLALGSWLGVETARGYYVEHQFWPGKAMLTVLASMAGLVLVMTGLILDTLKVLLGRLDPPERR